MADFRPRRASSTTNAAAGSAALSSASASLAAAAAATPSNPPHIPPAPPLPPQRSARNAFTRFVTQPFTTSYGGSSRSSQDATTLLSHEENQSARRHGPATSSSAAVGSSGPAASALPIRSSRDLSHKTGLAISALDLSADQSLAVLAGREILKTIRIEGTRCTDEFNLRAAIRHYSIHSTTERSASGSVSARNSRAVQTLDIHDVKWSHGSFGTLIATAGRSGRIVLYDINHPGVELARLHEHPRQVHRLAFNPHQGALLLSASQDGTTKLWDLRDYRKEAMTCPSQYTHYGQADGVRDVKWSPNDVLEFAFATDRGVIQRWDYRQTRAPKQKINAHEKVCHSIDWHPEGKYLISASADHTVKVWDFATERRRPKPTWTLTTPYSVLHVKWRPGSGLPGDNRMGGLRCSQIVTSYDREHAPVHIWDLARPFMPHKELVLNATAPTDLAWRGSDLICTVGREGIFHQKDLKSAPNVIDRRPLTALGIAPQGSVLFTAQKRRNTAATSRKPLRPDAAAAARKSFEQHRLHGLSPSKLNLSGASSDGVAGGDETLLSSSFKKRHVRAGSNKSTKLPSGTPPAAFEDGTPPSSVNPAATSAALSFNVGSLEEITPSNVAESNQMQPVLYRAQLHETFRVQLFSYLARQYLVPHHVSRDPAPSTVTVRRTLDSLYHFSTVATKASMYRDAQAWNMLATLLQAEAADRQRLLARWTQQNNHVPASQSSQDDSTRLPGGETPLARPTNQPSETRLFTEANNGQAQRTNRLPQDQSQQHLLHAARIDPQSSSVAQTAKPSAPSAPQVVQAKHRTLQAIKEQEPDGSNGPTIPASTVTGTGAPNTTGTRVTGVPAAALQTEPEDTSDFPTPIAKPVTDPSPRALSSAPQTAATADSDVDNDVIELPQSLTASPALARRIEPSTPPSQSAPYLALDNDDMQISSTSEVVTGDMSTPPTRPYGTIEIEGRSTVSRRNPLTFDPLPVTRTTGRTAALEGGSPATGHDMPGLGRQVSNESFPMFGSSVGSDRVGATASFSTRDDDISSSSFLSSRHSSSPERDGSLMHGQARDRYQTPSRPTMGLTRVYTLPAPSSSTNDADAGTSGSPDVSAVPRVRGETRGQSHLHPIRSLSASDLEISSASPPLSGSPKASRYAAEVFQDARKTGVGTKDVDLRGTDKRLQQQHLADRENGAPGNESTATQGYMSVKDSTPSSQPASSLQRGISFGTTATTDSSLSYSALRRVYPGLQRDLSFGTTTTSSSDEQRQQSRLDTRNGALTGLQSSQASTQESLDTSFHRLQLTGAVQDLSLSQQSNRTLQQAMLASPMPPRPSLNENEPNSLQLLHPTPVTAADFTNEVTLPTVVDLIYPLISHEARRGNAQFAAHLLLLIGPILPRDSDIHSAIEFLVDRYARHFSQLGLSSIQFQNLLAELDGPHAHLGVSSYEAEAILTTYHEQLQTFRLWNEASLLRRLTHPDYPVVYEQGLGEVDITLLCQRCRGAMAPLRPGQASKTRCDKCLARQAPCAICWCDVSPYENSPVFKTATRASTASNQAGSTAFGGSLAISSTDLPRENHSAQRVTCTSCGHTSHAQCFTELFRITGDGACPTPGCLCACANGTWRQQKANLKARLETRAAARPAVVLRSDDASTGNVERVVGPSRAVKHVRTALTEHRGEGTLAAGGRTARGQGKWRESSNTGATASAATSLAEPALSLTRGSGSVSGVSTPTRRGPRPGMQRSRSAIGKSVGTGSNSSGGVAHLLSGGSGSTSGTGSSSALLGTTTSATSLESGIGTGASTGLTAGSSGPGSGTVTPSGGERHSLDAARIGAEASHGGGSGSGASNGPRRQFVGDTFGIGWL